MENPQRKLLLLRALLIIAAAFWVFSPALQGDWLMDDDIYLTQNVLLHDPARLWKIWFVPGSLIEYYPIEATVQAVQWHLWHFNTLGYHFTNLILHIIGALLVWRLLAKFGLKLAWLGGFLFVIHPVVVESVAWISELKNTLSLPPFLLAMCCWIDYQERKRPRDYFLALGLFLFAMLCKISMALFPLIILLYAWWRRGRIGWNDLKTAMPFFAISLVLGMATVFAGIWFRNAHLQPMDDPRIGSPLNHLALAGQCIAFYFVKVVWPVGLLPVYPKWPVDYHSLAEFLPWPILIGVLGWLWTRRASWGRHALLGLGFFLINLLPFIGFTSVTYMGFTWVMDHFLYLPMIGLIGLAIAALENIAVRLNSSARPFFAGITAAVLALLALESYTYAGLFVGPKELWTYTVAHNPNSWIAYTYLGNVLFATGHVPEAIDAFNRSISLEPRWPEAPNNLGVVLEHSGRVSEAIASYEQALKINPHFALAHLNLARVLSQVGRTQEAIGHYQQALLVQPGNSEARANLVKLQSQEKSP